MAQQQVYPTYDPRKAALVERMLSKGRRADQLPVFSAARATHRAEGVEPHPASGAALPVYRSTPEPQRLPIYNPERTPERDERLTGEGGAELAARQVYPKYDAAAAQAEEGQDYPIYDARAASGGYSKGPAAQRLDDLLNTKAVDHNGRLRSGAKYAGLGPSQPTDSLGNMAGQALARFLTGSLFKTNADEELGRQRDIAQARPAAEREAAEEKRALDVENTRSEIDYRSSGAEFNRTTRKQDAEARAADRRKRQLLGQLGKMPTVDPAQHAAFLGAWQREYGEPFDVEGYNNKKSNFLVKGLITDTSKPQEVNDVAINLGTGEQRVLGRSGYTPPRDASGMTETERRGDADRDRGYKALERQRSVSNELQRAGLNLSRERFDFTKLQRDDRLSETARKEMGAAAKLRSEAEQMQMDAEAFKGAGMFKGDDGQQHQAKWAAQKWKAAEDKAEALRREYFQTYGYLHAPDGGEMKMTMDEFRQLFPNAPNPMASAPAYGVVITDSTQPGTPHTNNYPTRRSAPRAPAMASPSSPAQPRGRVSRANFGRVREQNPHLRNATDAEVESALRAQGVEVY
jgi:hypothetical protein